MEPSFNQGDLLLLTHIPNVDWTSFPALSNHYDDIDTFPLCAVEHWSDTEGAIQFARCAVNQASQLLICYSDNRSYYPVSIPLANVKAIWSFSWSLSNRALNPAQQLVYQVAQLQHELRQAKVAITLVEQSLAQANEHIVSLQAQLTTEEPAESPQPARKPGSISRKRKAN